MRGLRGYIVRRLFLVIPTLLILSVLVFLSVRFIPGDVIDVMVGRMDMAATDIDREALERRLGLDVPVWVQYGRWLGGIVLRGSLDESLLGRGPVEDRIIERLPVTLELGVLAILIGLVIALPVGIYSAIRQDTVADFLGRSVAIIGLATPNFWLGIMVMIYPTVWWGWTPPTGIGFFHRGSAGESLGVPDPQPDSGNGLGGRHHADDAHHDAGGAQAGLYPHRLVQGAEGAGGCGETRRQECPQSRWRR